MVSRIEIHNKPQVYSWGVKVDFTLNENDKIKDFDGSSISLLWSQKFILNLESRTINPAEEKAGSTGYRLTINATDTASEAETIGLKIAYSLLSVAIEKNWELSLSWPDSPQPCRVIDRTVSTGTTCQGFLTAISNIKIDDFVQKFENSFIEHEKVPYNLFLSMELLASSRIEKNERSKLIMLMSALEALAEQKNYGSELSIIIKECKAIIGNSTIDDKLKNSLKGQINGLKRESVRKAIQRLLSENNINEEDRIFIDSAYESRSKIVHEGRRVSELNIINSKLEKVLINIYEVYQEIREGN